jgi:hypothetical protein
MGNCPDAPYVFGIGGEKNVKVWDIRDIKDGLYPFIITLYTSVSINLVFDLSALIQTDKKTLHLHSEQHILGTTFVSQRDRVAVQRLYCMSTKLTLNFYFVLYIGYHFGFNCEAPMALIRLSSVPKIPKKS